MTADDGIIDVERNLFTKPSWVKQGYRLTPKRSRQIEDHELIGKTIDQIKVIKDPNVGAYLAFVAIRWSFLKIENDVLVTTNKWDDRHLYFDVPKQTGLKKPRSKTFSASIVPTQQKAVELKDLESIRNEVEKRRKILFDRAHNESIQMDPVERDQIIEYLEKENLPQYPDTEVRLLKEFVSSALSINQPPFRTRNRLKNLLGEIVLGKTIALCLSRLFSTEAFLDDDNWIPLALNSLATEIKRNQRDDFELYVLDTISAIALVMQVELVSGLSKFYSRIDDATSQGPEEAWEFTRKFTRDIPSVGPVLMSDFLKNVGYLNFVKIDFHLKREFPALLSGARTDAKSLFILSWHLCEELGMTPFIFDHIMYQWGRAKQ